MVLEVGRGDRIEVENAVRLGEACAVQVQEMQRNSRDRLKGERG